MIDAMRSLTEIDRRGFVGLAGGAFGLIPLASLLSEDSASSAPRAVVRKPKVSRVVFLFMNGGPSQIDTFDPKPALERLDGKKYTGKKRISTGKRVAGTLWKSEFRFRKQGECGLEVSELFPEIGKFADDLCVIRSMQTTSPLHAPALLKMNTGRSRLGAPSLGAWVDYGLGKSKHNLPSFVVMLDQRGGPISGHGNWSTGALPTVAPTMIHSKDRPLLHLSRRGKISPKRERRMRKLLVTLNRSHQKRFGSHPEFDKRLRAYEQAWKMQAAAPEAVNLAQETKKTRQRYGLDNRQTSEFGTRCLLARRLLERGVRFIQIYSGGGAQENTWDSHTGNVARHRKFAGETDRPIAAFLQDLKQTGLWKDTLVVWGGEFGRTPVREDKSNGRDHNPQGFTMWLGGGAVQGGRVVGATDEIGFQAVENVCSVADLHATILHLLGIDHTSLKYYHNGVSLGLTGPEPCRIIKEVLR